MVGGFFSIHIRRCSAKEERSCLGILIRTVRALNSIRNGNSLRDRLNWCGGAVATAEFHIHSHTRVCWIGFVLCDSQRQRQLAAHITWKRRTFHVCYISVWSSLCYARTDSLLEFSPHLALCLCFDRCHSLCRYVSHTI